MATWNEVVTHCRARFPVLTSRREGFAVRVERMRVGLFPAALHGAPAVFLAAEVCGEHRLDQHIALEYNGVRGAVLGLSRGMYVLREAFPLAAGLDWIERAVRDLAAEARRLRGLVRRSVDGSPFDLYST
jgi:hypothetical protein